MSSDSEKQRCERKVLRYIEQDRPRKLRKCVAKYNVDLKAIRTECGGNLLHFCIQCNSSCVILQYLLDEGVSPSHENSDGKLPVKLAMDKAFNMAQEQFFTYLQDYIIPLRKATTRRYQRQRQSYPEHSNVHEDFNDFFNEIKEFARNLSASYDRYKKREEECHFQQRFQRAFEEDQSHFDSDPFQGWEDAEDPTTSHEDWFESIRREREEKHRRHAHKESKRRAHSHRRSSTPPPQPPRQPPPQPPPSSSHAGPKPSTSHSKEEHQRRLLAQKAEYEARYVSKLNALGTSAHRMTFRDIPWPAPTAALAMEIMFVDLQPRTVQYKHYLRSQHLRWHPDKFEQKFGQHLCQKDKPKVMAAVKELSQCLNKLT